MPRFVGELGRIDTDLAERGGIFFLDVVAEHQIRVGIAMQPAIVLDLGFQLPGAPTGIAEREDRMLRARSVGDRLEDVDGGGQTNAVVDPQRGVLDVDIARMQHAPTPRTYPAPPPHLPLLTASH